MIKRNTGDVKAKKGYQKGIRSKITDLEAFKTFAELDKDCIATEMSTMWHNKVSESTILRYLRKINFTRKKRATYIKNEMKKPESNFVKG